MDNFKMNTMKDYTKWDIKCTCVSSMKNEKKMIQKIKRKVRRSAKMELKKGIYN